MSQYNDQTRLDANESAFFNRDLETKDPTLYRQVEAETKALEILPMQSGLSEDMLAYRFKMYTHVGIARLIANAADDLPSADAFGEEAVINVHDLGLSYGFDLREIKAAARGNFALESEKAAACASGHARAIDELLSSGKAFNAAGTGTAVPGLQGALNITNAPTFTLTTKNAGGLTWAVATPDEIVADVTGAIIARRAALKTTGSDVWQKYRVVLPPTQYGIIATRRMGDGMSQTILQHLLGLPWVESIHEWFQCVGAGAGGTTDRMFIFAPDSRVLAAIVPQTFRRHPAQQKNLRMVINTTSACAGVVCRYLMGVVYADGL